MSATSIALSAWVALSFFPSHLPCSIDGSLPLSLQVHAFSPGISANSILSAKKISGVCLIKTTKTSKSPAYDVSCINDQAYKYRSYSSNLFSSASSSVEDERLPSPSDMKLREIQSELKDRKVSFGDCFDRDSLTKRLIEARESNPIVANSSDTSIDEQSINSAGDSTTENAAQRSAEATTKGAGSSNDAQSPSSEFDRQSTLASLRPLKIKDLRTQLSQNNVRWGTMIEKEELVQALCNVMEEKFLASRNFSRSGEILPGKVTDVDEKVLLNELGWNSGSGDGSTPHAPILLDVYATWCGPCQFLVPELQSAAEELGSDVRIMKLDSDKYPGLASQLKVGGLPTLILFDGGDRSKEVDRMEGALRKDGILQFIKRTYDK